jgi:hypothetical protein
LARKLPDGKEIQPDSPLPPSTVTRVLWMLVAWDPGS